MTRTPQPTARDIENLLAFLPRLYAEGFTPIASWGGGEKEEDGAIVMPWPEYDGRRKRIHGLHPPRLLV